MAKKVSKRQQQYLFNKAAKTGEKIICPICKEEFVKKQYSQAFCCSQCKDAYWNAKGNDSHRDFEYYRRYNNQAKNREQRLAYARENTRILIGNGYDPFVVSYDNFEIMSKSVF